MKGVSLFQSPFRNPNFCSFIAYFHNLIPGRPLISNPAREFVAQQFKSSQTQFSSSARNEEESLTHHFQISHPWHEWVDLMEKLVANGYFDGIGNPFSNNRDLLGGKEANLIRTACLNFARDHYQIIRYLSRSNILVIAGSGCPTIDRKVVNSGKRLRALVGIDEGSVCSTCILRGDCDRAYVKAREDEGGRTVDVMRLLLTYGLDPIFGSVENKQCLNKRVKDSVRTLLKEMDTRVEGHDRERPKTLISDENSSAQQNDVYRESRRINSPMKQGDWICPKCSFVNFSRNIKCLGCGNGSFLQERLKKLAEDQEHLPLKKGDWICDKCNFLNFARNTKCLQCKEKPPKRKLNPGEWECESCNYINFRRNMLCLKCDHRKAIAFHASDNAEGHITDNVKNHKMHLWFGEEEQSRIDGDDSLEFVRSDDVSSSWNQSSGFIDFPIIGGKSVLSRNVQKQELWNNEIAKKGRHVFHAREDAGRLKSGVSHKKDKYIPFGGGGDDDDEMAEWFTGGIDDKKECRISRPEAR